MSGGPYGRGKAPERACLLGFYADAADAVFKALGVT